MNVKSIYLLFVVSILWNCSEPGVPPEPIGPLPSPAQIAYQEMEFNGFVHFNMNTFSNMEWGYGDEKPSQFNPIELDANQWVTTMQEAGMKGVIITAKHHDGFCLWPSEFTEHSVKNSPWRNGKGDVLKELSEACKEHRLKFGVYLSPWDRNHADYGTPEYITYFRNQLRELLTNYGEIFEVWFDGANGGDGYYGGANETRKVDKRSYYDWEKTYELIYELQPNAIIFGDAGPGCRWIGNEHGYAYPTTWSMLLRDSVYGGMPEYGEKYSMGQENGTHWVPGEADVSIRPGWYYHPYEDHKVKSLSELMDIYYNSIGQNSTLLLNFPVDKRGLIHEKDKEQVLKMANKIEEDFKEELAVSAVARATNNRGSNYNASKINDGDKKSYWSTEDRTHTATITLEWKEKIDFNRVLLQENIELGQRIKKFSVEVELEGKWINVANETTIGYKRILRMAPVRTRKLKINILDARSTPTISNVEIYNAPTLLVAPKINRLSNGTIAITIPEAGPSIHYTKDGSTPNANSPTYSGEIKFLQAGMLKAIAIEGNAKSEVATKELDVSPRKWSAVNATSDANKAFDEDPDTWWSHKEDVKPDELIINLNENLKLGGFTYLPTQQRWVTGFIEKYEFHTSLNGINWNLIKAGEFANIVNSPTLQRISFDPVEAQYIKLKSIRTHDGKAASFAEIGVVTK